MRQLLIVGAVTLLAGCGADGEPIRPSYNGTISAGSDGVSAGIGTSIMRGNVRVVMGTSL